MSWSKIPMALRIAIALEGVFVASAWFATAVRSYEGMQEMFLFRYGCSYVVKGFALYGVLELVTLVRGRAKLGARLAVAGWAGALALAVIQAGLAIKPSWRELAIPTTRWAWWAAMLAIGGGLAIAAARKPTIAIAGGLVWFVSSARPPVVDEWLWKYLLNHTTADTLVYIADIALQGLAVGLLAAAAVGDVPDGFAPRDSQRVRWGMTKISGSLWLRLIAMVMLPLVTMATLGDRQHGVEAVSYAMIGALAVNALAMLAFGFGALDAARSNDPDLRRPAFYVAAAAALWCAGVMIDQVPELYHRLFTDPGDFPYDTARITVEAFEYLLPLVALAAVAAWTIGVDGFATRRERLDLSERSQRTAVLFIVLTFASFAVTRWLLPDARTDGSRALVMLVALVCGASALFNAAKLASDTAELGDVEQPQLPTATAL